MSSRSLFIDRNPGESSRAFGDATQKQFDRNARLTQQNDQYRQDYPSFDIPSSFYEIVFVNRYSSIKVIQELIEHFGNCFRFTIDTESDCYTNELSLIQVHSISSHLPSLIVLIELNHLSSLDFSVMEKLKELFRVLFRFEGIIYSWGSLSLELKPIISMHLFTWPIQALLINLQEDFSGWYCRALPPCVACGSNQFLKRTNLECICMKNFPKIKPTELWSLQNAIRYAAEFFLDKTSTKRNWSACLDPRYSSLSTSERLRRVNYAVNDCLSVTCLHKPITEDWSLDKFRESPWTTLFTTSAPPRTTSTPMSTSVISKSARRIERFRIPACLQDDSNEESDEEVFISSVVDQSRVDELVPSSPQLKIKTIPIDRENVDIDIVDLNEQEQPSLLEKQHGKSKACRSAEARTKRNWKRNRKLRSYRDQHVICRQVYHRFTQRQMKRIIKDRGVRQFHLIVDKSSNTVSIGWRQPNMVARYFQRLPGDLFDKDHYYRQKKNDL